MNATITRTKTAKMIAYRIQQPEHKIEWLLDPEFQFSTSWYAESDIRVGVSACASVEDLATYFAQSGVPLGEGCQLVAMECDWADDDDLDAALGAILVIPTAIVSAEPITDAFYELVGAAYDQLAA